LYSEKLQQQQQHGHVTPTRSLRIKKTERVETQTQSCDNVEPQSFKIFLALRSLLPPPLPLSAACRRCARGHDSSSSRIIIDSHACIAIHFQ
jgi:hypothetical protein